MALILLNGKQKNQHDSYQNVNQSLCMLVESSIIIGVKIVAEKTSNTHEELNIK